jgi:RHS repeat-associated protein
MTTSVNKGTTASQTQVSVTGGTALSAGLSGTKTVTTSGQTFAWGTPAAGAIKAASIVGQATRSTSFGYDTGVAMASGNAPARRVGLFVHALVPNSLNADGWALFDAGVRWAQPAKPVRYVRDPGDRIIGRIVGGTVEACYGFTAGGDSPDQTLTTCTAGATATETSYGLAGGMGYTKRQNGTAVWSAPNVHGDVAMTFDQTHTPSSGVFTYSPDGVALGGLPENSTGDYDHAWLGQHQRGLEHAPGLHPTIEMGARPYNPDLGRFLTIDPIDGGTPNDYVYPHDGVNQFDLSGTQTECAWGQTAGKDCTGVRPGGYCEDGKGFNPGGGAASNSPCDRSRSNRNGYKRTGRYRLTLPNGSSHILSRCRSGQRHRCFRTQGDVVTVYLATSNSNRRALAYSRRRVRILIEMSLRSQPSVVSWFDGE